MNDKKMEYAPVLIPTLFRFSHFKQCVESLNKCTHSEYTDVYIAVDYPAKEEHWEGYRQIKDYLSSASFSFKSLNVIYRDTNYFFSEKGNLASLRNEVFEKYDRLIISEDDNVFSPCFLDYINKCLEAYKDNPQIRSVSGFTHPAYYNASKPLVFCYDSSAWGMGQWREKETYYSNVSMSYYVDLLHSLKATIKLFFNYPLLLSNLLTMVVTGKNYGDTKRTCLNIMNDSYQVRPYMSVVKNIGVDGSGVHCKADDQSFFDNQEILSLKEFPFERVKPVLSISKKRMWKFSLTPNTINKMKIILASMYIYVKYRLKRCNK